MNKAKIAKLVEQILIEIGEDPKREGLLKTPDRVANVFEFITSGYRKSLKTVVNDALFTQEVNSMIVVKDIEMYSTCEHHMLPFFGKCHIGYIAEGKVLGVSKLARIVDMFASRLQLQERLTEQIAHAVMEAVHPSGVGVVIEAQHLCMMMRGVEKQNSVMVTSALLGNFRANSSTREEFLSIIGKRG
ncbi:MAG TPA: GTP cyclohydrolase I FolE [Patescibacteria group bacterium]